MVEQATKQADSSEMLTELTTAPDTETEESKTSETVVGEPTTENISKPEGEIDYKARYEAEVKVREKAEQRARSLEGTMKGLQRTDGAVQEILRGQRRSTARLTLLEDHITNPEADPQVFQKKRTELNETSAQQDASAREVQRAQRLNDRISRKVTKVGANLSDPRFAQGTGLWARGTQTGNIEDIEEAYSIIDDALDGFQEAQAKEEAQGKVDESRKAGKLAVDTGQGAPSGGVGDQELVNRMARGDPMTPEEIAKGGKALDKGLYPNLKPE